MSKLGVFTLAILALLGTAALGLYLARENHQPPVLFVTARPAGAAVFVDDVFHGFTAGPSSPGALAIHGLAPGRHVLRVTAEDHLAARQAVQLVAGTLRDANLRIDIDLAPLPRARVRIESEPRGALVLSAGLPLGRTPLVLSDLEPGPHAFTVALDNYIPQVATVELAAGTGNPPVAVKLLDRQVAMYRARLAENPKDIQGYNDFGEYLYNLGDKKYAAEIYAEGFYQLGEDKNNRLNEAFNKAGRGRDKDFMNAFDDALVAMVSSGKHSIRLWEQFNRAVERHPDDPAYVAAFASLAKHSNSFEIINNYLERAVKTEKLDHVLPAIDRAIALPADKIAPHTRLLDRIGEIWTLANKQKNADLAAACVKSADALDRKIQAVRPFGLDALWPFAMATFAKTTGRVDDYLRYQEAAVLPQDDRIFANRGRLNLARAWRDKAAALQGAEADAARRWVGYHAAYILKKNLRVDPSKKPATGLLQELEAVGIAPATEWTPTVAMDDWMVIGPFPAGGRDPATLLEQPLPPETVPYRYGQQLKPDDQAAAALSWTRVVDKREPPAPVAVPAAKGKAAGVWYALGWFKSDVPRDLILEMESAVPCRVYVKDDKVYAADEAKKEQFNARIPFGWRQVLVKWVEGPDASAGWSIVARDERDGTPLTDLFWTAGRE